jgi:hypothetical protein
MSALVASYEEVEMRRRFDEDDEDFDGDSFQFDDQDEEEFDDEDGEFGDDDADEDEDELGEGFEVVDEDEE